MRALSSFTVCGFIIEWVSNKTYPKLCNPLFSFPKTLCTLLYLCVFDPMEHNLCIFSLLTYSCYCFTNILTNIPFFPAALLITSAYTSTADVNVVSPAPAGATLSPRRRLSITEGPRREQERKPVRDTGGDFKIFCVCGCV